jgi:hypothetical protein
MTMMKLVMEAVMLLAVVCGIFFISKISSSENMGERIVENEVVDDSEIKENDNA